MVKKKRKVAKGLSSFSYLFPWNSKLYHPINDPDWIGRYVDNRRHLHSLSCPDIEFAAMTWTYDVEAFNISITQRTIIVRADVCNGKKLTGDIDDDDRFALYFDEQTLPIGELGGRSNIKKFSFR